MIATIKEEKNTGMNINHRKEDNFYYQYTVIIADGLALKEVVTLRLYYT